MKTSNRERQRKWKKKQISNGRRAVTVMLPTRIKDLIDNECKKAGDTIAEVIEKAVINLLEPGGSTSAQSLAMSSNNVLSGASNEEVQQIVEDLKGIVQWFEKLTGTKPSVTSNKIAVTNDGSGQPEPQNRDSKEIYRLVRLLHNMEVSHDEIAFTLNKRKYKTLSGDNEWKLGDIKAVLDDINQKYGHIDPLFPILDNP